MTLCTKSTTTSPFLSPNVTGCLLPLVACLHSLITLLDSFPRCEETACRIKMLLDVRKCLLFFLWSCSDCRLFFFLFLLHTTGSSVFSQRHEMFCCHGNLPQPYLCRGRHLCPVPQYTAVNLQDKYYLYQWLKWRFDRRDPVLVRL